MSCFNRDEIGTVVYMYIPTRSFDFVDLSIRLTKRNLLTFHDRCFFCVLIILIDVSHVACQSFVIVHPMSDFNLFSSKTDIKKLLFTTEKFKFDEQCSNDSWQDLPGITPTSAIASFLHHQTLETSSISDNRNETGWETVDDYAALPKADSEHYETMASKSTGHGRLDRHGHWLLLSPLPPPIEPFFPDSCESLTVSVDLHVPTDELITDLDSPRTLRWRQKQSRYCAKKNSSWRYENSTHVHFVIDLFLLDVLNPITEKSPINSTKN